MVKFIVVVDYGLGNLRSVSKALEACGAQVKVTNQAEDLRNASAIVLPGVGAFKRAMDNLKDLKLIRPLRKVIKAGKPFLGICLGLQILFSESEEHGAHKGLGIIKGKVRKFAPGVKIPHMGWNQVRLRPAKPQTRKLVQRANHVLSHPERSEGPANLFNGIADDSYFYFVHSYYVEPEDPDVIMGVTGYKQEFTCAINKDNVWGVQFHPEKSQNLGLKFLKNFVNLIQ